jgi:hypothetical protein
MFLSLPFYKGKQQGMLQVLGKRQKYGTLNKKTNCFKNGWKDGAINSKML